MTRLELAPDISVELGDPLSGIEPPRRPLSGNALRGLKRGLRGYSRFSALIFFASLVIAAAAVLQCNLVEWCLLLGAIGLVLSAELFQGAVQGIVRGLDDAAHNHGMAALDMAAASAFIANLFAVLIGAVVFWHRVSALFCG